MSSMSTKTLKKRPLVSPRMRDRARELRSRATPFEQSFWVRVRAGRFGGFKFRRQQPLGAYVVDFVCQQAMLVVELDGAQHVDHRDYDQNRDQWLVSQGYRVFRVWNHEWLLNQEAVLEELWALLHNSQPSPPTPLPRREREDKSSQILPKNTESTAC